MATRKKRSARISRTFPQERARETHRRLLDAAREVFAERGFDETQTPDIAERAGVAVGTFYRYFSDKRQAFLELVSEQLEAAYEDVMRNLEPEVFAAARNARERRRAVEHVIEVLFRHTSDNPRLHRAFMAVALRDDAVARIQDDFEERGRMALGVLLRQLVPAGRIPNPAAAAHVIQVAAQDVAFVTAGLRGRAPTVSEAKALRSALADMIYKYVFGEQ